MPSFRFTKELTSYKIDIALIKSIEEYLCTEATQILKVSPGDITDNYEIKLTDSFGTESFPKIGMYKHPIFPNDISEIQINLQYETPRYLNLVVAFSSNWKGSRVAIELESEKPREDIVAIWNRIERILSFNKTNHRLFYGNNNLSGVAGIIGLILPLIGLFYSNTSPQITTLSLSGFILIILWYTVGAKAHPYMAFDTQNNKVKKSWSGWFLFGMAGLIVFDTIFVIIYNRFFS